MLKKLSLLLLILVLALASAQAKKVEVSIMFCHYSVGWQIIRANCHVANRLADANVVYGSDTAQIVFRQYWLLAPERLTDSAVVNCSEADFFGYDYDLINDWSRTVIWAGEENCGLLDYMFNVPNKENQKFWKMFTEHNVPTTSGDSALVKYDLVVFKNPYITWYQMTPQRRDMIKGFYEAVRDSISHHPDINVGLMFGTPAVLHPSYYPDSSVAKLVYDLADWFGSDQFFTHTNDGPYKNVWAWDSYTYMCETALQDNRYCLKWEYFDGDPTGGSHLSEPLGAGVEQDSLVAFIERVAHDILIQKSGDQIVTPQDIDRKIMEFRNGTATQAEVQALIELYNQQTGTN